MDTLELPNEPFLKEVSVLLAEGKHVIIRAKGSSMLPIIHDGYDVELYMKEDVRVGDMALAYTSMGKYVLHRIIDIRGDEVTLMGDGNLQGTERCGRKDVSGVVLYIIDGKGRRKRCDSPFMKCFGWLWMHLKPMRRYILGIYRRLICV